MVQEHNMRVTVRGDGIELRGTASAERVLELAAALAVGSGTDDVMVLASPHDPTTGRTADELELYDLWGQYGASFESDSSKGRALARAIVRAGYHR